MRRIGSLVLALIALAAVEAAAQTPPRPARVAFLGPYGPGLDFSILVGFQTRLVELGWSESSLSVTYRWAEGRFEKFPDLAAELAAEGPDVLVIPCGPSIKKVLGLRPAPPIVARCMDVRDFQGEIAGLGRAGGRVTGVTYFSPGATGRRLELLKQAVPGLRDVALLYRPGSDWIPLLPSLEATARGLGLRTHRAEWGERHTLDFVLDDAVAVGARAVLTLGDGILHFNRHHLFALAAERKLPAMYDFPMFPAADDLGLMAYYADVASLFRRTAEQVDQILKGRKPGDIPVTEPQQFRFMVNVRAAQALGLTLPDSLVRQADNVLK